MSKKNTKLNEIIHYKDEEIKDLRARLRREEARAESAELEVCLHKRTLAKKEEALVFAQKKVEEIEVALDKVKDGDDLKFNRSFSPYRVGMYPYMGKMVPVIYREIANSKVVSRGEDIEITHNYSTFTNKVWIPKLDHEAGKIFFTPNTKKRKYRNKNPIPYNRTDFLIIRDRWKRSILES